MWSDINVNIQLLDHWIPCLILEYTNAKVRRRPRIQSRWCSYWLTTNEDFDLAEVQVFPTRGRNLHDQISAGCHRPIWWTFQWDSCSISHDAWILATHVVVPQGRCSDCRRHVRQSNDKVLWTISWTNQKLSYQREKQRLRCAYRCIANPLLLTM